MALHTYPFVTLLSSSATYSAVLLSLTAGSSKFDPSQFRRQIKTISSVHSASTTLLALYALNYSPWPIETQNIAEQRKISSSNGHNLDDTNNPIISGKSTFANKVTAWETGYLVYDTAALLWYSYLRSDKKTVQNVLQVSPLFLGHHLLLVSALYYLQIYIANGREKGIWVIVAFLLMNSSNPLLHMRWALKKKHGKVDARFEAFFVAFFAVSRFGLVTWVLGRYGKYHSLGPWQAYRMLRLECKSGVAVLVGLNAIWWIGLLRTLAKNSSIRSG